MKDRSGPDGGKRQDRAARLAEELRANLARRKAQARLRRSAERAEDDADVHAASRPADTDDDGG